MDACFQQEMAHAMNKDRCLVGNDCSNAGEGAQKGRRNNRGAEENDQPNKTVVSVIMEVTREAISVLKYSRVVQVFSSLLFRDSWVPLSLSAFP